MQTVNETVGAHSRRRLVEMGFDTATAARIMESYFHHLLNPAIQDLVTHLKENNAAE